MQSLKYLYLLMEDSAADANGLQPELPLDKWVFNTERIHSQFEAIKWNFVILLFQNSDSVKMIFKAQILGFSVHFIFKFSISVLAHALFCSWLSSNSILNTHSFFCFLQYAIEIRRYSSKKNFQALFFLLLFCFFSRNFDLHWMMLVRNWAYILYRF